MDSEPIIVELRSVGDVLEIVCSCGHVERMLSVPWGKSEEHEMKYEFICPGCRPQVEQ